MIMQQLGLTKLNILCKIEHNSLLKVSRYFKISRNKLIFSGFSCHFGFYPLKFCSKRKLRNNPAKFSLFHVFDSNQSQNVVPRKWSQILINFPLLIYLKASSLKHTIETICYTFSWIRKRGGRFCF